MTVLALRIAVIRGHAVDPEEPVHLAGQRFQAGAGNERAGRPVAASAVGPYGRIEWRVCQRRQGTMPLAPSPRLSQARMEQHG